MIINKHQMDEINAVQYEIFKAFHSVCERLNLRYFLVHGSLLGALRYNGFFPMDDDIDVAMPRKDYDIFMSEAQKYFNCKYFVQSHLSEEDYPLVFGKVRANGTAFIQPVLQNCSINKGIYIDIFPIDNYPIKKWKIFVLGIKEKMYKRRVFSKLNTDIQYTFKSKFLLFVLKILMPSWKAARNRYCGLYSNIGYTGKVIVRGGKAIESGINAGLFGTPTSIVFEKIHTYAPEGIDEYLKLIYGDYMNYEPMGKDMISETEVRISASVIDIRKSYKEYEM